MLDFENLLKEEVEKLFGNRIVNATDCKNLSVKIHNATGTSISSQTLRRFWGIIKYENKISNYTRNTLSKYVGYLDFNDFINKVQNVAFRQPSIDFTIIQSIYKNNTEHADNWSLWHEGISRILAENIIYNQNLFEQFVQTLHTNQSAMDFVIAHYQCYSLLQYDWHLKGYRIFCNNSNVSHHRLYLLTLEYLACLLNDRESEGSNFIPTMIKMLPSIRKKYGCIFPLEGAVYGCLISNAHANGKKALVDKYLNEAKEQIESNLNNIFPDPFPISYHSFVHTLIEVFLWVGLFDIALDVISVFEFKPNNKYYWKESQIEMINLNLATIQLQTGNQSRAEKIFQKLNIEHIRFDKKDIVTIQFMLLQLGLTKRTSKVKRIKLKQQIIDLCNKSGLIYLKKHIPIFEECT